MSKEEGKRELDIFFEAMGLKKAKEILALDLREKGSVADFFILASGSSNRQVSAIAEEARVFLKEKGKKPIGVEGMSDGRWVLMDYGNIVVHIFFEEVRKFYDLEGLWSDTPSLKPEDRKQKETEDEDH